MKDRNFKVIGHAKGCNIKSRIKSRIHFDRSELELGDHLNFTLILQFDPEDIPDEIVISAELPDGFKPLEPQTINVHENLVELEPITDEPAPSQDAEEEPEDSEAITWEPEGGGPGIKVPITFEYTEADPGAYSIDFVLTHVEFGTELSTIGNKFISIKPPEIKISDCSVDQTNVVKGSEVTVRAKIECSSTLKFRGIMGGQVFTENEAIVHRRYELPTKRIAIIGAKEISWNFKIPQDETGTGKFNVEIEFASRDTATSKVFENILSLKKAKAIEASRFISSNLLAAEGDAVKISVKLENIGIEAVDLETTLNLNLPSADKLELEPIKKISIAPGENTIVSWDWKVPPEPKLGKVKGTLAWKILDLEETHELIEELLELKNPHEYSIKSVITDQDYYGVGDKVRIKAFIKDSGTKAGDMAEVEIIILDIFGKEIYRESAQCRIDSTETVKEWTWNIPKRFDAGTYDIQFIIKYDGEEMVKKNFPKLLNIDVPIKLKLHLVLPDVAKKYRHLVNYLREREKVINSHEHHKLSIYALNSNTWLYSISDNVPYGIDFNVKEYSGAFQDNLFSFIVTKNRFSKKYINSLFKIYNEIGICWSANVSQAATALGIKNLSKFKLKPDNWLEYTSYIRASGKGSLSKVISKFLKSKNMPTSVLQCTLGAVGLLEQGSNLKFNESSKIARLRNNTQNAIQRFTATPHKHDARLLINDAMKAWHKHIKSERASAKKNEQTFYYSQLLHGIIILELINDIYKLLEEFKQKNYVSVDSFSKYVQAQIFYYLTLIEFYQNKLRYDPYSDFKSLKTKIATNIKSLNAFGKDITFLYDKWRRRLISYQQNMSRRKILATLRTNLKITTNPIEIEGMKGDKGNNKILLGNSGELPIKFRAFFALPSKSWSLIEPETANTREGVAMIKKITVSPKQTIEIPVGVQFPKTLTFKDYTSIMKIEPIIGNLKNEI